MIKKYLLDILCLIVVVIVAFLIAERPVIDLIGRTGVSPVQRKGRTDVSPVIPSEKTAIKEEAKKVQKEIVRDVVASKALKDRNIFSADGRYPTPGVSSAEMKGPLPENPYTLIGILHGEEKKAVLREYTGSIVFLSVGKKLIDDSIITRIDNTSVEVKKGKEKRELKIFDIKPPKPLTSKRP
jgi:hypothetical protein